MKNPFSGVRYLWKSQDIRRKLIITLVILVIFRLAANVPVPGINGAALKSLMSNLSSSGSFFSFLDLLSGGTVSHFSLLSMGVYPYITAQIILQLLTPIFPALQRKMEEDPREGRKWQEKWIYYLAVPMAALSALGQINIFNSYSAQSGGAAIVPFGFTSALWLPSLTVLITMIGGTMFAIWLGELISEYGIRGQGLSLIIFAGIVARIPSQFGTLLADKQHGWILVIAMVVVMVAVIYAIVYVNQGRRNVPVMYPGRRVGNRMSMPVKGTLPLMVNLAGMIPLIFASAILQFPAIISSYFTSSKVAWVANFASGTQTTFNPNNWVYQLLYFLMVVIFTFFYTDVMFSQQNYGENLKKVGAQIPGINRGAPTQKYLTKVQRRITLPGALFLGLVAVLGYIINLILKAVGVGAALSSTSIFLVSSAGLLIVVGVVRDTFLNIDAELKLHGYDDAQLVKVAFSMPTYIVLLGPPGVGKGTQAKLISESTGLPHISSGDLFRENIKIETNLGKMAQSYMNKGELVPDDVTIGMIRARLSQSDCKEGALLDGFPRTTVQADSLASLLDEFGGKVNFVPYITASESTLIERLSGRWTCKAQGHTFHEKNNPPKQSGVCDFDGSQLYQRDDDRAETVERRIQVFFSQTVPLINYYRDLGLLSEIDGAQPIEKVTAALLAILGKSE